MGWRRLADEVIRRRVELGHDTRASFIAASGLSARTVGDIETARRTSYDPATLARLEQALRWPADHVRRLVEAPETSAAPRIVQLPDDSLVVVGPFPKGGLREVSGSGPAELLTPEGLARYLHRDDLVLVALLHRSGLDEAALFRLILRIRARREQQNAELLAEVAGLVREAGGHAPDPAYPPTWLFEADDSGGVVAGP